MAALFDQYFAVHADLVNGGHIRRISNSALRFYLVLCWKQDNRNSRVFKLTDREVNQKGKISTRSLALARRELKKAGLIQYEKIVGGAYVYTVCDPQTGLPYVGDPTVKPKRIRKLNSRSDGARKEEFTAPSGASVAMPDSRNSDEVPTSFNFGFNELTRPPLDPDAFSPFTPRKIC